MSALRIHGAPHSTWTRTVLMTCVEKGVDHELVPIRYGSDEHRAMHPFARIPVLEHGDLVLSETLAITGYVDEAFDGPPLQPGDVDGRTAMRRWMGVCADYVFRDVVRTVPRDREPTGDELGRARAVLERVDAMVATGPGPFLTGDDLSLADLYLAPQVSNAREKAPELLAGLLDLDRWSALVAGRESTRATAYDAAAL